MEFPTNILPDLQSLRKGTTTTKIRLVLASFKQEEPAFAAKAIDYLISAYEHLPPNHPLFDAQRGPKQSASKPPSTSTPSVPSTSQQYSVARHSRKRRRTGSLSNTSSGSSMQRSSTAPESSTSNNSRSDQVTFIPINIYLPPNSPRNSNT